MVAVDTTTSSAHVQGLLPEIINCIDVASMGFGDKYSLMSSAVRGRTPTRDPSRGGQSAAQCTGPMCKVQSMQCWSDSGYRYSEYSYRFEWTPKMMIETASGHINLSGQWTLDTCWTPEMM